MASADSTRTASHTSAKPTPSGYARYVGRVGALAFALGVGAGIASMPVAFADNDGSAGASASSDAGPSRTPHRGGGAVHDSSHNAPAPAASVASPNRAPRAAAAVPDVEVPSAAEITAPPVVTNPSPVVDSRASASDDSTPASAPIEWTAVAATRGEVGTRRDSAPAPAVR